MPSLAHLFYSSKKLFKDRYLEQFSRSEGGCRRKILIDSIGGLVEVSDTQHGGCCDVCSVHPHSGRLDLFSVPMINKRKRRRAVREVNKDLLEEELKKAREDFMTKHPAYQMVGIDFICPTSTIKKLCEEARFIVSIDDLPIGIRSELKDVFFRLLLSSTS